jgi:very-short-patch-repair endonuclease
MSHLELRFLDVWNRCEGLPLEQQYRFHSTRKWRFDFAHPKTKIAIEIEGGEFVHGRHGRPGRLTEDCIKYATAMQDGWEIWRLTGTMITREWLQPIADRIGMKGTR